MDFSYLPFTPHQVPDPGPHTKRCLVSVAKMLKWVLVGYTNLEPSPYRWWLKPREWMLSPRWRIQEVEGWNWAWEAISKCKVEGEELEKTEEGMERENKVLGAKRGENLRNSAMLNMGSRKVIAFNNSNLISNEHTLLVCGSKHIGPALKHAISLHFLWIKHWPYLVLLNINRARWLPYHYTLTAVSNYIKAWRNAKTGSQNL